MTVLAQRLIIAVQNLGQPVVIPTPLGTSLQKVHSRVVEQHNLYKWRRSLMKKATLTLSLITAILSHSSLDRVLVK